MKEQAQNITSVNSEAIYPIPLKFRMPKRWKVAERTNVGETIRVRNSLTEHYYKEILLKAKELYATLSATAFERNYREDNAENALAMHSFLTASFHWYLECSLTLEYQVNFDFHQCPFEPELKTLIEKRFYILQTATHRPLQPNCAAYFKRVQQVQETQYFYLLKA